MAKPDMQKEAVRLRVEERLSYKEILSRLDVAKSSLSLWLRDFPLNADERKSRSKPRGRKKKATTVSDPIAENHIPEVTPLPLVVIDDDLGTVKKGKAAECIVLSKALLSGYDCFGSTTEDAKTDMIVNGHRVQVKVLGHTPSGKSMPVRKVKLNSRTNCKVYHYTKDDIDFFIAVDLETFDTYVVPIDFAEKYRSCISISVLNPFKNRFDLLSKMGR